MHWFLLKIGVRVKNIGKVMKWDIYSFQVQDETKLVQQRTDTLAIKGSSAPICFVSGLRTFGSTS